MAARTGPLRPPDQLDAGLLMIVVLAAATALVAARYRPPTA